MSQTYTTITRPSRNFNHNRVSTSCPCLLSCSSHFIFPVHKYSWHCRYLRSPPYALSPPNPSQAITNNLVIYIFGKTRLPTPCHVCVMLSQIHVNSTPSQPSRYYRLSDRYNFRFTCTQLESLIFARLAYCLSVLDHTIHIPNICAYRFLQECSTYFALLF